MHEGERAAPDGRRLIRRGIKGPFGVVVLGEDMRRKNRHVPVDAPELLQEGRVRPFHVHDGDQRIRTVDARDIRITVVRDIVIRRIHCGSPRESKIGARHLHAVVEVDVIA